MDMLRIYKTLLNERVFYFVTNKENEIIWHSSHDGLDLLFKGVLFQINVNGAVPNSKFYAPGEEIFVAEKKSWLYEKFIDEGFKVEGAIFKPKDEVLRLIEALNTDELERVFGESF